MKYDLTSDLIFFIPLMKVENVNKYNSILDFIRMGLFLFCQGMWGFVGLSDMIR